jgi:hypothetical protein
LSRLRVQLEIARNWQIFRVSCGREERSQARLGLAEFSQPGAQAVSVRIVLLVKQVQRLVAKAAPVMELDSRPA